MKKKKVMSVLLLSVLALSHAGYVLADEVTIGNPSETVVTSPSESSSSVVTEPTKPVEPVVPTIPDSAAIGSESSKPTTPNYNDSNIVTEPTKPVEPVTPTVPDSAAIGNESNKPTTPTDSSSSVVTEPTKPVEPSTPTEKKTEKTETKTENESQPTVPVEVKEAEKNVGVSSTGTPKQATVTEEELQVAPILTNTGHEILGTLEGQVYVKESDGTVSLKNASDVGAVKQSDGTVALKDKENQLKVLPKTGETSNLVLQVLGVGLLIGLLAYAFKDTLQSKFGKKKEK